MTKLAIGGLGPTELIIILVIVLLIFGAGKLPQIGDALGKSFTAFKKASRGEDGDTVDVTPAASPAPQLEDATASPAQSDEVEVETVEEIS